MSVLIHPREDRELKSQDKEDTKVSDKTSAKVLFLSKFLTENAETKTQASEMETTMFSSH